MIPVDEANEECRKCEHFDMGCGCVPTYLNELPPCGRNIILCQKTYKELFKELLNSKREKNGKRKIFGFMQRNRS